MPNIDWLEPSIESGVTKAFSTCDERNMQEDKDLKEMIDQLRENIPDQLIPVLSKIENAIFARLFSTVDAAYRNGFLDAWNLRK
jgi:hypothetical protein